MQAAVDRVDDGHGIAVLCTDAFRWLLPTSQGSIDTSIDLVDEPRPRARNESRKFCGVARGPKDPLIWKRPVWLLMVVHCINHWVRFSLDCMQRGQGITAASASTERCA